MLGVGQEKRRLASNGVSADSESYVRFLSGLEGGFMDDVHETVRLQLLLCYVAKEPVHRHYPYVMSLPKKYTAVGATWRAEDVGKLRFDPSLYAKAAKGRLAAVQLYLMLTLGPGKPFIDASFPAGLRLSDFMLSNAAVVSRQNMVPKADGGGNELVLTPLWDMMNHSADRAVCVESAVVDGGDGEVVLRCEGKVRARQGVLSGARDEGWVRGSRRRSRSAENSAATRFARR